MKTLLVQRKCNSLAQSPGPGTPRAAKLQLGAVRDLLDVRAQQTPLVAQQHLGGGLAAGAEATQHDLEGVDLAMPAALVQLVKHVGTQLVGGVVGAALRLLEADVAGREGEDGAAVRLRDGDVGVVLVRVDVEVEGLVHGAPVLPIGPVAAVVRARQAVRLAHGARDGAGG